MEPANCFLKAFIAVVLLSGKLTIALVYKVKLTSPSGSNQEVSLASSDTAVIEGNIPDAPCYRFQQQQIYVKALSNGKLKIKFKRFDINGTMSIGNSKFNKTVKPKLGQDYPKENVTSIILRQQYPQCGFKFNLTVTASEMGNDLYCWTCSSGSSPPYNRLNPCATSLFKQDYSSYNRETCKKGETCMEMATQSLSKFHVESVSRGCHPASLHGDKSECRQSASEVTCYRFCSTPDCNDRVIHDAKAVVGTGTKQAHFSIMTILMLISITVYQ